MTDPDSTETRWGRSPENAGHHGAAAILQHRFPGCVVWFGEHTGRYFAMAANTLLEAPSLDELTLLLRSGHRIEDARPDAWPQRAAAPRPPEPGPCLAGWRTPRPHDIYGRTHGTWQPTEPPEHPLPPRQPQPPPVPERPPRTRRAWMPAAPGRAPIRRPQPRGGTRRHTEERRGNDGRFTATP